MTADLKERAAKLLCCSNGCTAFDDGNKYSVCEAHTFIEDAKAVLRLAYSEPPTDVMYQAVTDAFWDGGAPYSPAAPDEIYTTMSAARMKEENL